MSAKLPRFSDVTLATISWKAPLTVAHTLESYHNGDILDLFGARMIHFNEISEADREIAGRYGFEALGTAANIGIYGGVAAVAALTRTPFFLFVENDCPLVAGRDEFIAMLAGAVADMKAEAIPVFQMRSRRLPGEPYWRRSRYEKHFRSVWPLGSPPEARRPAPALPLRLIEDRLRPYLRGSAIFAEEDPTLRHPGIIKRSANGNWVTTSRYLNWSNCCFLIETRFLRDVILDHVRRNPAKHTLNGHQEIEGALKEKFWWRKLNVAVAQCEPGPFTHERLDR